MNYKLIAFDIDGTIRSMQDPVSDKTTSIINLLIDNGIIVTIATGRMFLSASLALEGLNIIHPIISCQGAHIADINTGKILWHMPLTKDMSSYALDFLKNWQVQPVFYHEGEIYVDCLTDIYAVEAEFDYNWKEAIGQSLHYAETTNKRAAILLIKRQKSKKDYYIQLERVIKKYQLPIKVFLIEKS